MNKRTLQSQCPTNFSLSRPDKETRSFLPRACRSDRDKPKFVGHWPRIPFYPRAFYKIR